MAVQNDVFIGSTTGIVKGISVRKDIAGIKVNVKNYIKDETISNKNEINCMAWYDKNENDILIGKKNGIKLYNTNDNSMNDILINPEYSVCGVFNYEGVLIFATESGVVRFWKFPFKENQWDDLKIGNNLARIKQSILSSHIIGTGGRENDLKLWDANTRQTTFSAKNVKPDELQLTVPIWVSDICFFNNNENVAYCSRHGHVRLFDPLLPQRRPVLNTHLQDEVFTCISSTPRENHLLVGSGSGNLHLLDLRGKGLFIGKYKGFSGAVKSISCTAGNDQLVFSTSLDRHFRIHDFHSRKLLVKEYAQSRLTSVLVRKDFLLQDLPANKSCTNSTEEITSSEHEFKKRKENDLEDIFKDMDTIEEDKPNINVKKNKYQKLKKRKKTSSIDSDISEETDSVENETEPLNRNNVNKTTTNKKIIWKNKSG